MLSLTWPPGESRDDTVLDPLHQMSNKGHRKERRRDILLAELHTGAGASVFYLSVSLLFLVPLTATTAVFRVFVLPKFVVLLIGSSLLVLLLLLDTLRSRKEKPHLFLLRSPHVILVCLYFLSVSASTMFGAVPKASLFGSVYNQMGLITQLCFFVCFAGLVVGINSSQRRLIQALSVVAFTGLLVAAYAISQLFSLDPFVPSSMYTFGLGSQSQVRVASTLGHSDYLGNFLLYTTLLSAVLGVSHSGRLRYLAAAGAILSVVAIGLSGTRGAWLGLIAGGTTIGVLEVSRIRKSLVKFRRWLTIGKALLLVVLLAASIGLLSLTPSSRALVSRVRSFTAERLTGSGRTTLWRDSIAMVPQVTFTGSGPESFRRQFLSYKSKELARLSGKINNESSHNSYLDAVISYGLLGGMLYVSIIASALALLIRTRRRVLGSPMALIISGACASLIAVLVHNFFIYDQISTGLYFFSFIALAQIVSNVVGKQQSEQSALRERQTSGVKGSATRKKQTAVGDFATAPAKRTDNRLAGSVFPPRRTIWLRCGIGATACVCILGLWYSVDLLKADMEMREVEVSASRGDFSGIVTHGKRAAESAEPTGAYNFLFVSMLAEGISKSVAGSPAGSELEATKARAFDLAVEYSPKPLAHTLTPELNGLLLAYLAWAVGDMEATHSHASEVLDWDPNNSEARWLMAEALLARGEGKQARGEARLALDLNPGSVEARLALRRARASWPLAQRIEVLIDRARTQADAGDTESARRILTHALRLSDGNCPKCENALARLQ